MKSRLFLALFFACANALASSTASVKVTKIEASLTDLTAPPGSSALPLGPASIFNMSDVWVSDQGPGFAAAMDQGSGWSYESHATLSPSFGAVSARYAFTGGLPSLEAHSLVLGAAPPNVFGNTMSGYARATLAWGSDAAMIVPANMRLQIRAFVEAQVTTTQGQGPTFSDVEIAFATSSIWLNTPTGPAQKNFGISVWGGVPTSKQQASWLELSWDNLSGAPVLTSFSLNAVANASSNLLATSVPEPGSFMLLAMGLAPVWFFARKKRRTQ